VPGAEALDFRDVQGVDADTAYLLSIGKGATSRVYKTTDGGAHWMLRCKMVSRRASSMRWPSGIRGTAFWWATSGRPNGSDGQRRRRRDLAAPEDAAGASRRRRVCRQRTGIAVLGDRDVWIGTGGKKRGAGVSFRDAGRTWSVVSTPIRADADDAGIFSLRSPTRNTDRRGRQLSKV